MYKIHCKYNVVLNFNKTIWTFKMYFQNNKQDKQVHINEHLYINDQVQEISIALVKRKCYYKVNLPLLYL